MLVAARGEEQEPVLPLPGVGDGAKVRLFAEVRWAISHQM